MIFTALINVLFFILNIIFNIISPLLPALPDSASNALNTFNTLLSSSIGYLVYLITFGGNSTCVVFFKLTLDIFLILLLYRPIIAIIKKLLELL